MNIIPFLSSFFPPGHSFPPENLIQEALDRSVLAMQQESSSWAPENQGSIECLKEVFVVGLKTLSQSTASTWEESYIPKIRTKQDLDRVSLALDDFMTSIPREHWNTEETFRQLLGAGLSMLPPNPPSPQRTPSPR